MKSIPFILLIALLLFVGCEKSSIELKIASGEYRAQWEENYTYDLPILIDNYLDWDEFLANYPARSVNEDILQQNYNNDFFMDSVIYAYVKSEGSGSTKLEVYKAELSNDQLRLFMERTVPKVGTDDMATRICLFGIKRDDIKNVKEVEGIILE